jgi:hypothetical protein
VKFVEQQLLCALKETPPETECSVSIAILRIIGHHQFAEQQRWLCEKRAPENGKAWHMSGEHWEYTAHPDESVSMPDSFPVSPHLAAAGGKRTYAGKGSQPPIIVVNPVRPLQRSK